MGHVPPAFTRLDLGRIRRELRHVRSGSLDAAIGGILGSVDVATASSWVLLLGLFFRVVRERRRKSQVVLARHSCWEFTQAVELAGCLPVYVDVDERIAMPPGEVEKKLGPETLAVLSVNNCGIETDNAAIHEICRAAGVVHVEDATYTFLGASRIAGRKFGTFGDVAVLNFSEGKFLPVGGGGLVLNEPAQRAAFREVKDAIERRPPASCRAEWLGILRYVAGTSRVGYTLAQAVKSLTAIDLKKRMSMEITRRGNGTALDRAAPLNRVKQAAALTVLEDREEIKKERLDRYRAYREALAGTRVRFVDLPEAGALLRVPILLDALDAGTLARLRPLGVVKLYGERSPLHETGEVRFPRANHAYEHLVTLPVHSLVGPALFRRIVRAMREIAP